MSSYLAIAEDVLRSERQPLSARQIMRLAYQRGIVPHDLHGKTQFKTLHARIAEDILLHRERSPFIRTGPGRFFLRVLLDDPDIPEPFKREYPAPLRADQLRNFEVLSFARNSIEAVISPFVGREAATRLGNLEGAYSPLTSIQDEPSRIHLRVFVVVHRKEEVVVQRRWGGATDNISGFASLGFMSFLKAQDKTLFSHDALGIRDAALRALVEQLYLTRDIADEAWDTDALRLYGLLFTPHDQRVSNAMAAIVSYRCSPRFDPVKRFGSPGPFRWMSISAKVNDPDAFDPWSRHLLEAGLLRDVASL